MPKLANLLVFALMALPAFASQATQFEVASLKVNRSGSGAIGGMAGIRKGGALNVTNIPLRDLVGIAYDLETYRVIGPAWIATNRYDLQARPDQPVSEETAKIMLRSLLAERFKLEAHAGTTQSTGYILAVGNMLKLKPTTDAREGFRIMTSNRVEGPGSTATLSKILGVILHVPVIDKTGLTGIYDIDLKWVPDNLATEQDPEISIFAAIKMQTGLVLKPVKVPVRNLIITHAETVPTDN